MESPTNNPAWAKWMTGKPGVLLAFLWGFAEGTLFFILPDVPLSLAALLNPRRAFWQIWAIVAGAVLGGAVMFTWSAQSPSARSAVARVPLISAAMFERADRDFREFGVSGVSRGPLRGIPYKVYAVEAPVHARLWPFLLVSIPARLWRLVAVWLIFAIAGAMLRKLRILRIVPYLHGAVWVLVYLAYWVTMTR